MAGMQKRGMTSILSRPNRYGGGIAGHKCSVATGTNVKEVSIRGPYLNLGCLTHLTSLEGCSLGSNRVLYEESVLGVCDFS